MSMAVTAPNMTYLSTSSSSSSPSLPRTPFSLLNNGSPLTFQIPKRTTQVSCLTRKAGIFTHSTKSHELAFGFSHVGFPQKGAGLEVAKAAEVEAPTASEPKPPKKKKVVKPPPPRRVLDPYQIIKTPVISESAIQLMAEENTLLFNVHARADKKMIREAVNSLFDVKIRKINTSIRPDGTKKAYIMLNREYNASEVAVNIGVFPNSA